MKNNRSPQEVLSEITSNYTPEQKENFKKYLNSFGISEEQLKQNGINI